MRKIREVLRLTLAEGLSRRHVVATVGLPYATVARYLERAAAAGITWPLPQGMDDRDLEGRLFSRPAAPAAAERPLPDWAEVHRELARKGVIERRRAEVALMGRPTLLTAELAERIASAVRGGSSLAVAAAYAGIAESTLSKWLAVARALARGDDSLASQGDVGRSEEYLEFLERIEKARADAHVGALAVIRNAMAGEILLDRNWKPVLDEQGLPRRRPGEWTAAAWFLERRYPQEYGRTERVDLERILATILFGVPRLVVMVKSPAAMTVSRVGVRHKKLCYIVTANKVVQ